MSLKIRKKSERVPKDEELLEFAQLALDIFMDKRHVVGAKVGHKNANRTKLSRKN